MILDIFLGFVMLASITGMILCMKKQNANPNAKPAAIGLLVVIVLCAITFMVRSGDPDPTSVKANELIFKKAKTYMLGKKLAELNPGGKVLFVVASTKINSPDQDAMIEGFKEGAGSAFSDIKVVAPPIKIPKSSSDESLSMEERLAEDPMLIAGMMKAKDFNKMLASNKGYDIVVTTIGLPDDAGNLTLWKEFENNPEKCHKLAFVNGDISKLAALVKAGLVQGIVRYKQGVDYDALPTSDMEETFDIRYMLITKDNIDKVIQDYPNIFDK